MIAAAIRLIQHPVYSSSSPRVRVTVVGGCPQSLGKAIDVSSPGPNRWSELFHYSRLARSGAIGGLVCQYGLPQTTANQGLPTDGPSNSTAVVEQGTEDATALANMPPQSPPILQSHAVLTPDQARAVSLAAFTQSTLHPSGTFHCPSSTDSSAIIVVLSYPTGADIDIWWNDTGCQNADNGHVEVYFYGVGLSGGDFTGAVEQVFPAAP
ncbi:MAG TPA: hypothetical protein VII50_05155 [Acidothermaceae bacterium]